jgi:O-antigen/teichoic acid export membrane protein
MKSKYYSISIFWGFLSKIIIALASFISIPFLIKYFGVDKYGVLTLGTVVNAYMRLLDLGINIGSIKYFAQWKAEGKNDLVDRVARTSITFYGIIGIINSVCLIGIAIWGENLFQLTNEEFQLFRELLIILAVFTILNWITGVFSQLLIANEEIAYTHKILSMKAIFSILLIFTTIYFRFSLNLYFFLMLLLNSIIVIPYYFKCKKGDLISSFLPQFYWGDFKVILKYSLALFALGLFQLTANQSRPILLAMFSSEGVSILTNYKIIEVFPIFAISIGGIFTSVLLPKTSKILAKNDQKAKEKLVYVGTIYTSIIIGTICFPIMLCADELLTVYVGSDYVHLSKWLIIWCATIILFVHSTPSTSVILATGKTKILVMSTAISCVISMLINAMLVPYVGVGSAVIGFCVYILIQMLFYYLYFYKKIIQLNPLKIFKSFIIPTFFGVFSYIFVEFFNIDFALSKVHESTKILIIIQGIVKSLVWFILFASSLIIFKVIKISEILKLKNS